MTNSLADVVSRTISWLAVIARTPGGSSGGSSDGAVATLSRATSDSSDESSHAETNRRLIVKRRANLSIGSPLQILRPDATSGTEAQASGFVVRPDGHRRGA